MSVIINYKLENEFSNLENKIKKLKSLDDYLNFQIIVNDSIKLLSFISKLIKDNNNLYGKNTPKVLLINIMSFLPYKSILICESVCVSWLNNLKSDLSKKILLSLSEPKGMYYCDSLDLKIMPKRMVKNKNNIYINDKISAFKIDIENFKIIEDNITDFRKTLACSNNNYSCCVKTNDLIIYSMNMKLISIINVENLSGVTINESNNIYVTTNNKFYIYKVNGNLVKSWDLIKTRQARKIAIGNDEIFVVNTQLDNIYVYSHEGILIRSFGGYGSSPGEFKSPWGIIIYQNVVFVVDSGNKRIQAFTRDGKFIFEHICDRSLDMGDIIIVDDYIFVNDWQKYKIFKFELTY
jgi:hypothetical protein